MKDKTLKILEFKKIIEKLASFAISEMGKQRCYTLAPSSDINEIKLLQKETQEAESIILKKGSLPLGGIKNIAPFFKHAQMGGVLLLEEFSQISDFLYVCRKLKKYSMSDRFEDTKSDLENFGVIAPLFDVIEPIAPLEKEINRCVISTTELSDDASQALYDIRKQIKSSNNKIREHLNSIIHSSNYKTMLQDFVITIRNGRYCVSVKQEYKTQFPGMVHDQSQSGATLFIEPLSVVNYNNKIKELLALEQEEINKILRKLSELVAQHYEQLSINISTIETIDFIFAKGELSLNMRATKPVFNDNGIIDIKKGRHPLLDQNKVVPIDIYVGENFSTLLITGPNTGGKTVALKTLGLFQLMGQAGLHIPAYDNSILSVFDNIFADIGDEQSIEQSLSTFSSHMTNIVSILDEVTSKDMVLFDELGAGTDPTEGGALAIAILQHLHKLKVITVVTTHYPELKVYALGTDGVENASCEFDVETLRPTYKLLIGVPGKSNAFAISEKLGLSKEVISSAKELISHNDARFEDVITDLEISKKTVIIETERAELFRVQAEQMKKELVLQKEKLAAQKAKILLEAKEEARQILQNVKDESEALRKEMIKQMQKNSQNEALETISKMRKKLSDIDTDISSTKPSSVVPINKPLKKGDKVFVHSLNQNAIVSECPDNNGDTLVTSGILKIKVNIKDLSLDTSKSEPKKITNTFTKKVSKSMTISSSLDLRGEMVSEAIERTDKYLDDAYLSALSQATIIHGKGTGALRASVQAHLKNHPLVKSYRLGAFGEGDAGVTIVEFNK